MAVIIGAKGSKRDGTAYFPNESKQRMPVEVVDRRWLGRHWNEITRFLSRVENKRLVSLQHLKQAIGGKSSGPETAASTVVSLSNPFQKFMDAVAAEHAAGGFQPLTPGTVWRPPNPPNPVEAASEFMFSLLREPRALLAAETTVGLSRVKPCMWLDKKQQLQFGLFCPDLPSAIYAVTSVGFGIAACLRCGELFLRDRADKQFCSPRCQNTYLTKRRRERNRSPKRRQRAA